jgi:hypothetical protein
VSAGLSGSTWAARRSRLGARAAYVQPLRVQEFKTLGFSFEGADSTVYTIGYKPLDETGGKMSGCHEAVKALAATEVSWFGAAAG